MGAGRFHFIFVYFAGMFRKAFLYLLFFYPMIGFSQIGGKYVYQFLNLVSSPREAALGGRVLTTYDYDVMQPLINPASLNAEMTGQLALSYVNYLGDVNYGSAAYAFRWNERVGVLHGGVTYIGYGEFEGRDEMGEPTGTFTGGEVAVSSGYAYRIAQSGFYTGVNLKFISSTLEQYHSLGGAFDAGVFYRNDSLRLHAALVLRNAGVQFSTYAGQREPLPLEVALGVSQQLANVPLRWHLTFENLQEWGIAFSNPVHTEESIDGSETPEKVNFIKEFIRHTILGVELFPDKAFQVRLGYNFRRGEELRVLEQRNFSGLAVGFGVKMNTIRVHYTYARYSAAANTSFFGLMIDLN